MAATRLIPLHLNKGKNVVDCLKERLDYAQNPLKTEDGEFVSSFQCDPRTAAMEFLLAKAEYDKKTGRSRKGDVLAYQIRQAFKPGEITPEKANQIGYELAMRFTKGKHAFTVSTHTDKKHIHNHIIFNSTALDCEHKFRNFFLSAFALQRCSDLLCFEHGLSIIEPKPYDKREKRTTYPARHTRRGELKHVIEMVFREKEPKDFDEFLTELERQGYAVKRGKHIAVKGRGQKRYIRLDSLGDGFDQESIKGYFKEKNDPSRSRVRRHDEDPVVPDMLIDIQKKALGKGAGYAVWAKKYNLKQTGKTLQYLQSMNIHSREDLDERTRRASEKNNVLMDGIKSREKRLKEIAELKKHIINYSKTKGCYQEYRKSGYSKKFFEAHREELTLHKAAKNAFNKLEEKKIPKVKDLSREYEEVLAEKKKLYAEYRAQRDEMRALLNAQKNVEMILGRDELERDGQERDSRKRP
ncbi:MAG: relaxase/mobilization nuclease domain-containing protein [Candidatus Weimeria sp.]